MNKYRKLLLPLALLLVMPLASCTSSCKLTDPSALLKKTPVTDSMKLNLDYEGKTFAHYEGGTSDHIGKVTVKSYTDGDTTNFTQEGFTEVIKVRYLGVNTPESTAKVEPWGKKASLFTKHTLEEAVEVVLVNDVATFGEYDGSGGRWLGFVWYRKANQKDLRCLNLEIVEQGYSRNFLFKESSRCPYLSYFEKAEANAIECGIRVPGDAQDPDYDYTEKPHEVSIRQIRESYDDYGISEDGGSGVQLIITGLVVGLIGDSPILRDVSDPDPDTGIYATMYGYTGYTSGLASIVYPGCVVKFYCRATQYNDNIQLSDISTSTVGKRAIKWWEPGDPGYDDFHIDMTPVEIDTASLTNVDNLRKYDGLHVKVNLTIRMVTPRSDDDDQDEDASQTEEEYYYKKAKSGAMTIYAYANPDTEVVLNIRKDASVYPTVTEDNFEVGHTYTVIGYIQKYFNKYQIMIYNQLDGYNYITEVVQANE